MAFWVVVIARLPWEPMTFPTLHSGDELYRRTQGPA
jgi:hypothetical protein